MLEKWKSILLQALESYTDGITNSGLVTCSYESDFLAEMTELEAYALGITKITSSPENDLDLHEKDAADVDKFIFITIEWKHVTEGLIDVSAILPAPAVPHI